MEAENQSEAPKTNGSGGLPVPTAKPTKTDEDEHKNKLLEWINKTTTAVIEAVREDIALRFHDEVDDEEKLVDLKGEFDPIVVKETGARLSEVFGEKAVEFNMSAKRLRRLYESKLKEKWQVQNSSLTELTGERFGKKFLVNRHGVWLRLSVGGIDELFVWRRIARTEIKPIALSRDTSAQRNWRHRYRMIDETGQFEVEVDKQALGKHANRGINKLMQYGLHVVESKEAREELAIFLRFKPRARILRAPRVGWFETQRGHWVFVLPDQTLGDVGKVRVVLIMFAWAVETLIWSFVFLIQSDFCL